jgi:hypothetical protein
MNQRIQELAQKAGLYVDVNGQPWPRNMNGEDIEGAYQKFAELIVAECAKIADTEGSNSVGCGYITKTNGMRIKEYFGGKQCMND